MRKSSRTRLILKWTSLFLGIVILAFWGASFFLRIRYGMPSRAASAGALDNYVLGIEHGSIFLWKTFLTPQTGLMPNGLETGWIGSRGYFVELEWIPTERKSNFGPILILPLWIPFAAIALPNTILYFRKRRRIRPGCCLRCGYDLTGNTSGVCSECGEKRGMANSEERIAN